MENDKKDEREVGRSAGRQMDRSGVKYRSTSHSEYTYMAYQYIIYIDTDLYLVRIMFICRHIDSIRMIESIKYKDDKDDRWVGRSAGRHIDRPRAKYRLISRYIIYD